MNAGRYEQMTASNFKFLITYDMYVDLLHPSVTCCIPGIMVLLM